MDQNDYELVTLLDIPTDSPQPEKFKWTPHSIKLLIDIRAEYDSQFYKNRNNTFIWKKIANTMSLNGYNIQHSDANDKFRNLMATYRANQDRASQSGEGSINWEYFETMKNNFGHKDSVSPKVQQLFESSIHSNKESSQQNSVYNSATQLSDKLNSKTNKPFLKPKQKHKSTPKTTYVNTKDDSTLTNSSGYTLQGSDESEDSDSVSIKPRVKKKKNVLSQILDLLKEEKKETQENNKQFFSLMGRLIELEEEKIQILKSKTT